MDKWQIEIHYKDGSIKTEYEIFYIEDDILIEYDEETSIIPEYLYLHTIDDNELYIDMTDIEDIYINKIENGEYLGEQYLFA